MNKILFFAMFLSLFSCQTIPYSQFPIIFKTAVYGAEDIAVSETTIAERKYSFIKVRFGKKFVALLTLVNTDSNIFEWITSTGEKVFTYNGKVIRTVGLTNNIHIYTYENFSCSTHEKKIVNYDVMLEDPRAFVTQSASIDVDLSSANTCYERVTTNGFSWSHVNHYRYNKDGLPKKAIQSIHPMLPIMEIDFYYKY
jgi:hypothetical protein